ncbi:TonB-dependent receptor [Hymenobacter sediminis]|uniref:TonB-dependent receptor plug domain-containing protein n=1 Tax=Hymenobacter sediminis TaxID=2218621 RepID=UPI000DA6526E|nr:TonB-dependent receptor [Hymenobacter sediminis]RPD45379.1 TonB-dependent receptor [Hymenobacter sediminis]
MHRFSSSAFLLVLVVSPGLGIAQQRPAPADTSTQHLRLREVVVTATRTEKALTEVPIPVTVVSRQQIQAMGAVRLTEVLGEQTGLNVVADHGRGVQMQGLNPEYTLILVDGEPLIGRTAGTLELSRVAVGNIERVEVVKGPASALWGSEALAGVVNIITQKPQHGTRGEVRLRYGANRTADVGGTFNYRHNQLGLTVFGNRYSSAGYTLQPASGQATVPPFTNYTGQSRLSYQLDDKTTFSVSGRYFIEDQASNLPITTEGGQVAQVRLKARQQESSLNPSVTRCFSDKLFGTLRFYHAGYRTKEDYTYTADGTPYDASYFHQTFTRPEAQLDWRLHPKHTLTVGTGYLWETVEATRYDQRQQMRSAYCYLQDDWSPLPGLNLVAGVRYDGHSQYQGQLSPKLSGRYQLRPWLAVRASAGRGFRAPDFRQLYLNFSNPAVGYSVFGTHQVREKVAQLAAQGQLALDPATGQPLINAPLLEQASSLTAESSRAYNAGLQLDPTPKLRLTANLFHNDLRDLIETAAVAQKTNGQSVYSYRNVSRAYTQGLETDARYLLSAHLTLSAGYQYLVAKDRNVVTQLKNGSIYRRDPETLETTRLKVADYGGLFNRSRHMANVKLFYDNQATGWSGSVRGVYRGRYGFQDRNGNLILDTGNEYVAGYWLWNVSAAKTFRQRYTLQAGLDNVLNYTDPAYLSTVPGRLYYASLTVALGPR